MRFLSTTVSFILAITSLSHASPVEPRQDLDRFLLQTQVVPGIDDSGSDKGGLYIFSYHTGAGLGIAAGSPTPGSSGSYFFLNDTTLLWTYEGNQLGPWKTSILYGPYQGMHCVLVVFARSNWHSAYNPISISIASDDVTPGFSIDGSILKSSASEGGWLMCDSWYQSPQLFALNGPDNGPLPTSCSHVNLVTVPAP